MCFTLFLISTKPPPPPADKDQMTILQLPESVYVPLLRSGPFKTEASDLNWDKNLNDDKCLLI